MTSPEKLATPDSVMALFRRAKSAYGRWVHGPTDDGLRECIERDNELRREVEALATQRQGEGETRDAALEQAAWNLRAPKPVGAAAQSQEVGK